MKWGTIALIALVVVVIQVAEKNVSVVKGMIGKYISEPRWLRLFTLQKSSCDGDKEQ